MFLWTRPAGLKVFRNTPEKAELTRVLAANQGLYNGLLAAGLAWAVLSSQRDVALFFLGCVVVAGLYGTATVGRRIFYVQAVPALAAIAAVLVAGLPEGCAGREPAPPSGTDPRHSGAAIPPSRSARGKPPPPRGRDTHPPPDAHKGRHSV